MINPNMKDYQYLVYSNNNEYGQATLIPGNGVVRLSITNLNTSIIDNMKYKDATYIGLTKDAQVSDKYVIKYGDLLLKVLYVVPMGRYYQVYLNER